MADINQEKRDKDYNYFARIQPAYISLLFPLAVCLFLYQGHLAKLAGDSVIRYIFDKIIYLVFITPALFFLYRFILRDISKMIIEKVLFDIFGSPTTKLMLSDNSAFTNERKQKIKCLIDRKFGINLDESHSNYKQRVDESVSLIREETRSNAILFEYNYIYGFYRNLSAGILLNIIFSVVLLLLNNLCGYAYKDILVISTILLIIFFLLVIWFAYSAGMTYAKRLYTVFISLNS